MISQMVTDKYEHPTVVIVAAQHLLALTAAAAAGDGDAIWLLPAVLAANNAVSRLPAGQTAECAACARALRAGPFHCIGVIHQGLPFLLCDECADRDLVWPAAMEVMDQQRPHHESIAVHVWEPPVRKRGRWLAQTEGDAV